MPTRSLGDYRLKHKEFNDHTFMGQRGYRPSINNYNGPYITHKPDIFVHTISENDKYLVISSDGMWDELKLEDIKNCFQLNKDAKADYSELYST
jgi:pyruvate dehydrogenase phosphatase